MTTVTMFGKHKGPNLSSESSAIRGGDGPQYSSGGLTGEWIQRPMSQMSFVDPARLHQVAGAQWYVTSENPEDLQVLEAELRSWRAAGAMSFWKFEHSLDSEA